MTDYTPPPVSGYVTQSQDRVDEVNINKRLEEVALRRIDDLDHTDWVDARWLAIGRTQLEQAFMSLNRAIFQPQRIKIEE